MTAAIVWQGRFIETVVDGPWEYVRRAKGIDAAVILAVTDADEIVLVEQARVPLGTRCLELPAGLVGDTGPEAGADASLRELYEETGFHADSIETIGSFTSSPGLTNEQFTLFRASGLSRTGTGGGVEDENIEVHCVPRRSLPDFIAEKRRSGVMIDIRLLAAITLL